ncbi:MAG: protein-L-isoaspartate O-methyltransferase [bacterium]|nr:protein-L-isoaspartate O-methyltransferase [bacterium]
METTESIKEPGKITNPAILEAFHDIRREDFLPSDVKPLASLNEALPIGYNQTISQPLTVGFMLELLEPKRGDRILDIGAGSGWTTALLSHIVGKAEYSTIPGKEGRVVGLEIIPELAEFGKKNVAKYGFIEKGIAKYLCQDANKGYPLEAPYDGILVSATLPKKELPRAWREQLKIGGKIVVPIQESIWVFTKKPARRGGGSEHKFTEKEYPGFVFVPFVS